MLFFYRPATACLIVGCSSVSRSDLTGLDGSTVHCPCWLMPCALALGQPGNYRGVMIMKNRNHRLVLECVILAGEVLRFANELLALLNMAINYPRESKVVLQV